MSDLCQKRLLRELARFEKNDQLAMAIDYNEQNVREIKALIIGPSQTPYAFGFYHLSLVFPEAYPATPPTVKLLNTNSGMTRFGPNIYADGKICLTWPGTPQEEWSQAMGLESCLLSIQTLLAENPYRLEPGYEQSDEKGNIDTYNAKITHENLRLTVIEPLEHEMGITQDPIRHRKVEQGKDSKPSSALGSFINYCKRRFLWHREEYMKTIQAGIASGVSGRRGTPFPLTKFEYPGNEMAGRWDWYDLKARFEVLEKAVSQEIQGWATAGLELAKKDTNLAFNLRNQMKSAADQMAVRSQAVFNVGLVDDNPFLWYIIYFGRAGTPLDEGVFKINIHISPNHPKVQPRVYLDNPMPHVRVASDGMLAYLPQYAPEMIRHIEGILFALEDTSPVYNPLMAVNSECTQLFWGTPQEKRLYTRRLRRYVTESIDKL
ncbi:Ubiquitin-conjugating enzyme E2 [Penicillium verhagenii]|nr:Ubiquitin-conjugating enzyme E2 [Penicillium verhagenii]